jgi:hypothetical protein
MNIKLWHNGFQSVFTLYNYVLRLGFFSRVGCLREDFSEGTVIVWRRSGP